MEYADRAYLVMVLVIAALALAALRTVGREEFRAGIPLMAIFVFVMVLIGIAWRLLVG
jgi:heme A synthase